MTNPTTETGEKGKDRLTDDEWRQMFRGPAWSEEMAKLMATSLRSAYRTHVSLSKKWGYDEPV